MWWISLASVGRPGNGCGAGWTPEGPRPACNLATSGPEVRGYPTTLDLRWRVRVMSTSGCGGDSNGPGGGVQSSGGGRARDADVDVADRVTVAGELVEHRERGRALLRDLLEAAEPHLPRRGQRAARRGTELEDALAVAQHECRGLGPEGVGQ